MINLIKNNDSLFLANLYSGLRKGKELDANFLKIANC